MKNNLVSVIVPVHNTEKYISKCLDSIITQTYKKLEIIVINDGSTDTSGKICDNYAKKDNRIKVTHQKNNGPSHARNTGINLATGKYICFVDSDDTIYPSHIEELFIACERSKADLAVCGINCVKYNSTYHPYQLQAGVLKRYDYIRELLLKIQGFTPNKLYTKELINDIRFREDITICEDLYFNIQLALQVTKVVVIEQYSYNYTYRPTSLTNNSFSEKKLDELKVYILIYNLLKESFPDLTPLVMSRLVLAAYRQKYFYKKSNFHNSTTYTVIIDTIKKYEKPAHQSQIIPAKQKILLFMYKYAFSLINFTQELKIRYNSSRNKK